MAAPVQAPRPVRRLTKVIPPQPAKPRRNGWWLLLVIAAVAVAVVLNWQRLKTAGQGTKPGPAVIRTATVRIGTLERTIRLTGITGAEYQASILAPHLRGNRRGGSGHDEFRLELQEVAPAGTQVKKGDFLAGFDRQYMLNRLDDYQARVTQHENNVKSMKALREVKRKAHEQRLRVAKGKLDKAALDMKTIPIRSEIGAELFRLAYAEAKASYAELQKETQYVDISESADIRRTELDLRETEVEARRAAMNAERMIVRSPMDGLVVLLNIRRQVDQDVVRVGDQLHSGYPFMQIVDLRSMVVEAEVNQADWRQLRVGARAHVRIDAFPNLEVPARVYSIGTLARGSRWRADFVKSIPVRLELEKADPRIIPNFSASADVVVESEPNVAIVPRECVFRDGAERKPIVFAQGPAGWEKREVELGLEDNVSVAVHAGLGEGEVIAAERPPLPPALPQT